MAHSIRLSLAAVFSFALIHGAMAQADYRYPLIERTVAVSHSDLDLNKPQDARVMLARIEHAARQACGFMPERDKAYAAAPRFVTKDFSGCKRRAVAHAVARLHAPVVSRLYAEGQSGTDVRQAAR